ncbi:MAG: MOSC domain-containing protein [Candidatus Omnitrophica bacterium]|nr:MOSC domain-containing protein [Candidatus Omnitrophota bacterium]
MKDHNCQPRIVAINISKGGIPKYPVNQISVKVSGLEGDGHNHQKHYRLEQAVCLQDLEKLDELRCEGYPLFPGTTGENITVKDLHVNELTLGTVIEFSGGLQIELTKVRKPCYVLDEINPQLKEDIVGRCGMYAKVLREGVLSLDNTIKVLKPCFL